MILPPSNHFQLAALPVDFSDTIEYGVLVEQSLPITVPHLRSPIFKILELC